MTADYDGYARKYEASMAAAVAALDSRWNATGYRAHRTHDGVAFVFTLRWGRMAVATVEDAGTGGGAWPYWSHPDAKVHAHDDDHGALIPARDAFAAEAARLFPDDGPLAQESLVEAILRKAGK